MRTPLWQQRKRASDLLAVASRFGSFPALLETYREVLRDHFDMPALVDTLRKIGSRTLRVATIDSRVPSPFAASLLFSYVANYIYDGDAPLAERRAQALSVDQAQLRELLGDAELRELLDADAHRRARTRSCSTLTRGTRSGPRTACTICCCGSAISTSRSSRHERRRRTSPPRFISSKTSAGSCRCRSRAPAATSRSKMWRATATRSASRCRRDFPSRCSNRCAIPAGDLALRYARSHGPFTARELAARYGLGVGVATGARSCSSPPPAS